MYPLILASTSKYRKELLARLNLKFDCVAPGVDEEVLKDSESDIKELAKKLAYAKAEAVFKKHPESVVIGSDQIGTIGNSRLDKPGSRANAIVQLQSMQGQTHYLHTAVAILLPQKEFVFLETTSLSMRNLTRAEIERYIDIDNPIDCAGSYKIETLGISLFEKIEGKDFTAITGLPLMLLSMHLREIGYELP